MPTQATVIGRIRSDLNEASNRFFQNDDLIGWFSDGLAMQHRVAVEMARSLKVIKNIAHPYLKKYGRVAHINVTAGASLYPLPTDFMAEMRVTLMDASAIKARDCIDYTLADDWQVENIPHMMPTFQRPAYGFRMDEATQLAAVKLWAFGDQNVANAPGVMRIDYVRDVTRVTTYEPLRPVDADDPYCEGPRYWAVAVAKAKRGEDPSGFIGLADRCAQNIYGPAVAASGVGQKAQGDVAAQTVMAGENRDAR